MEFYVNFCLSVNGSFIDFFSESIQICSSLLNYFFSYAIPFFANFLLWILHIYSPFQIFKKLEIETYFILVFKCLLLSVSTAMKFYTQHLTVSTVPCKKTRHFGYFPYKMAIFTRVKKAPKSTGKTTIFSSVYCSNIEFLNEFWLMNSWQLWSYKPSKLKVCLKMFILV